VRSAGVARTMAFLRHLPALGYRCQVLTTSAFGGDDDVLRAWEPLSFYRWLFNREAREGRAHSAVRTRRGYLSRLGRALLVPDVQISWLPAALWRSLRQLKSEKADLIYSTFPPASAHILGLFLQHLTGLPWVADFRDSWIYDPLDTYLERDGWRKRLEVRLEGLVVSSADVVIAASEEAAAHLRSAYATHAGKIRVVPNGFEPDEIPAPQRPVDERPLRIVHTGSFSFSHPRRTPEPLFAALQMLADEDVNWGERLQVVLVGGLSDSECAAAAALVEAGLLRLEGACTREEALAFQQSAHVLLLVDHVRPWVSTNVPGKFYEYLAMRRPVLSLGGSGVVERLVAQLRAGVHVRGDDVSAICARLKELCARHRSGALMEQTETVDLRRFHRSELTRQLANCFDEVVKRR
jgi:glycosyltransferase involved in cell wall biosynthesis